MLPMWSQLLPQLPLPLMPLRLLWLLLLCRPAVAFAAAVAATCGCLN